MFRYGVALLAFGAVIGLALLLNYVNLKLNLTIPIIFALVAVIWYCGRGPGLLLSILYEATTIIYTAIPPDSSIARAWFGYFSTLSLYVFLVLVISGLKRTQKDLSRQRDLLRVTLNSIGDAVIATDVKGQITYMNPAAQKLTGYHEQNVRGALVSDVICLLDEETREPVDIPLAGTLRHRPAAGRTKPSILVARDGREIYVDDSASPINDGGQAKGAVIVISDATERKLAERSRRETEIMHTIIEAQEAERHRIARDIHDHLGQKMTALRLQIESLTRDHPALDAAIGDAQSSASQIDNDIGYLSWELRPTELEQLGLENALTSFVREWSNQHQVNAEFHSNSASKQNGGRFEKDVETNLYRIVQEALNNILKHANASNVNVLLQRRDDGVTLIIEDDGCGFDPEDISQDASPPGGLGLISMRERVTLLNGTLEIESRPGSGTTILARVPFHRNKSSTVRAARSTGSLPRLGA